MHKGPLFSPSSPTLSVYFLLVNSPSDRGKVRSPGGSDLHFPDDCWCWASFHASTSHLYVFFGKMSIWILSFFFNQAVFLFYFWYWVMSSLIINFLSNIVCKYLLPFSRWPFDFVYFPSLYKRFFIWCIPIYLFLHLYPLPEETNPNNITKTLQCQRAYCICFLLKVLWFQVLNLSLSSILNLFLCMVWESSCPIYSFYM